MNTINIIVPYRYGGTWVFDDASVGLSREPFVAGIPEMMDILLDQKRLRDVESVSSTFSAFEFPGYDEKVDLQSGQVDEGTYYESPTFGKVGWLCPALAHYFDEAPAHIYVKFESCD